MLQRPHRGAHKHQSRILGFPKHRQQRVRQAHGADHVRRQRVTQGIPRRLAVEEVNAGIVDENVNAVVLGLDVGFCGVDGLVVGNVQLDRRHGALVSWERKERLGGAVGPGQIATADDDVVVVGQE